MKQNEEQIFNEIHKRNNNINFFKSETYLNNIHDLDKDKKKTQDKIKLLEKENSISMEKLEEIQNRRNAMQYQLEKELGVLENYKKIRLKRFIDNLNNKEKKELFEEKIKKFQEDSKKLQLKMKSDLAVTINKKNNKMDKMEKEKEEKIIKHINEMNKKEKENIKIRNQKAREQMLKLKELINKNPSTINRLYQNNEKNYIKKEEALIKNENKMRKEYMKHIDLKELNELSKNIDEIKSKQLIESKLKFEKEKQMWSQRYKLIPQYVNPLNKKIEIENNLKKKEEEKENLERLKFKNLQKNFKVPKPIKINKDKIKNIDNEKTKKKNLIKSNSYSDILRQKMMIKFNTTKNKKETEQQNNKNLNHEISKDIINFKLPLLCLKKKYKTINKSLEKDKNNQNHEFTTDYLNHQRFINEKKREKKRNIGESSSLDYSNTNDIRKLFKQNGLDENSLNLAKSKLESLDEKKKQKSLLLKLNGGTANKPELGEEICDLMIDSIQARLSIIQEIEYLDKNNNELNISDKQIENQNNELNTSYEQLENQDNELNTSDEQIENKNNE